MRSRTRMAPAAPVLATALLLTLGGASAVAGPFTAMVGDWSGAGQVSMASGSNERLRCRASNSLGTSGDTIDISIRCASDSYKIDFTGYMRNSNGSISGQWSETNYNSAGNLSGRASGNQINAIAVGNTFSARLSLTTTSSRMSISIRPEETEIRQVLLTFSKR